jgi:hypothetical protein
VGHEGCDVDEQMNASDLFDFNITPFSGAQLTSTSQKTKHSMNSQKKKTQQKSASEASETHTKTLSNIQHTIRTHFNFQQKKKTTFLCLHS